MRDGVSSFFKALILEEIRRRVAEAIKCGTSVSAAGIAANLVKKYPRCHFDEARLADEVMMAAAAAGVPVEIGKVKRSEMADAVRPHRVVVPFKDTTTAVRRSSSAISSSELRKAVVEEAREVGISLTRKLRIVPLAGAPDV